MHILRCYAEDSIGYKLQRNKTEEGNYTMLENLNSYLDDPIDGNKQDDEVEIDLLEIFNVLKSKFLILLTAGLLVGCLCGLFTKFVMTPVYTSTSSILVLSKETTLTSLADIQLGTSLTSDYTVLIKCTPVLEQVIKNLDLDMDSDALRKSISIENPSDSRILEISVQNTDPEQAKKIVDEIANVASNYIGDKMEVIPPKIIEIGKIPTVQSSPSMKKNVVMGFILGVVAAAAIVVVITIMDDTLKSEDDIAKYLGISVLAVVPDRKDYVHYKGKKRRKKRH